MKVINVYSNRQITCIQGAGGINLLEESWVNAPQPQGKTISKECDPNVGDNTVHVPDNKIFTYASC